MEKRNIKDLIIKIVLIIIIILLLIHNCNLITTLKNNNSKPIKTPTGNVDIFEISCNKDTCDDKNKETSIPTISSIDNNDKTIPSKGDDKEDEEDGDFTVSDNDITWKSTNELRIFNNPVYDMDSKIAPGDSNVYQFVVKNNTKYKVKYSIKFIETNSYNLNMKYRLKKGDTYVAGNSDYVDYDELDQNNININSKESNTYYLEWKWIGTDNDNHLSGIQDAYKISIEIEAESTNE